MVLMVKLKRASVYLCGMGMTGLKLRSIVSSIFERSRSAAGAMQGNVCHQGVSVARGHTCTTDRIRKFLVFPVYITLRLRLVVVRVYNH